jgi:hypothetical protein
MAALDFPASPTTGQIFVAPNGVTYQWTGTLWLPIGATQALFVGDTPPPSPGPNQLWWNSASGQMYLWYNDGSSTQWVPTTPTLPVGVPAPLGWRQVGRIVPAAAQATVDFPNIPADINDLQVHIDCTPTLNDVNFLLQFYDASGVLDTGNHYGWSLALIWNTATAGNPPQIFTNASAGAPAGGICFTWPQTGNRVANLATYPGNTIKGDFSIYNIRDATRVKGVNWRANHVSSNAAFLAGYAGNGHRNTAGAITGFRVSFDGGSTFAAGGAVTVWGSP